MCRRDACEAPDILSVIGDMCRILDMIRRFILPEPRYKSFTFQGGEGVVLAPMVITVIQRRRVSISAVMRLIFKL